jgi:hypothetical protein
MCILVIFLVFSKSYDLIRHYIIHFSDIYHKLFSAAAVPLPYKEVYETTHRIWHYRRSDQKDS